MRTVTRTKKKKRRVMMVVMIQRTALTTSKERERKTMVKNTMITKMKFRFVMNVVVHPASGRNLAVICLRTSKRCT